MVMLQRGMARKQMTGMILEILSEGKPVSGQRIAAMMNCSNTAVHQWIYRNHERCGISKMRDGKEMWYVLNKKRDVLNEQHDDELDKAKLDAINKGLVKRLVNMVIDGVDGYPLFMTERDAIGVAAKQVGITVSEKLADSLHDSIKAEFARQQHLMLQGPEPIKVVEPVKMRDMSAESLLGELGRRLDEISKHDEKGVDHPDVHVTATPSHPIQVQQPRVEAKLSPPYVLITGVLNGQVHAIQRKLSGHIADGSIKLSFQTSDRKS